MSGKKGIIVALGFFDSVHKGHLSVINSAKREAEKHGVLSAVVTFKGNLKGVFNKGDKCIYSLSERKTLLEKCDVNKIILLPITSDFLGKTKTEFLDYLNTKYLIRGYAIGDDYTFGSDGGNKNDLTEYAKSHGQIIKVVRQKKANGTRISTSAVKELLINGKIKSANALLSENYFITGKVKSDRGVGKSIGIPTANLNIKKDKFRIKPGVYIGCAEVDDKRYKAVINYGGRPTYNLKKQLIEAHLIDFNGDLYGKQVKIIFNGYVREIKKFDSEKGLKDAIKKDILKARGQKI